MNKKQETQKKKAKFYDTFPNKQIRELMVSKKNETDKKKSEIGKKKTETEELAGKLFVSPEAIRQWCAGYSRPDIDKLVPIANYFNVSVDNLLGKDACKNTENMTFYDALGLKDDAIEMLGYYKEQKITNLGCVDDSDERIEKAKISILNETLGNQDILDLFKIIVNMVFLKMSVNKNNETDHSGLRESKRLEALHELIKPFFDRGEMLLSAGESYEFYENTILTIFKRIITKSINYTVNDLEQERIRANPILNEYQETYKKVRIRINAVAPNEMIARWGLEGWNEYVVAQRDSVVDEYEKNPDEKSINDFKKFMEEKCTETIKEIYEKYVQKNES